MPYRIDVAAPPHNALDILVQLGALDVETIEEGLAAILPDSVPSNQAAAALGVEKIAVSEATARDNGSVWLLSSRSVRIGSILIASADAPASPDVLRLADSSAFGTGHHPSTALSIETLEEIISVDRPGSILDVGTGSGILALAALKMGVPQAVGIDVDADALTVAAENARVNHLASRLRLMHGGPEITDGNWPLVVANVLAAPLIEMAGVLVRRVGRRGNLILSGISSSLESEVRQAYQHFGLRHVDSKECAGWVALIMQASW